MEADKENITDGLVAPKAAFVTLPSPKKGVKKPRSLSIGPGALNVPLKEDSGNRRKVS
jgi:kinetochore protein Spc7/SPC105